MQWEELTEKAKKLRYRHYVNYGLNIDSLIKDLSDMQELNFDKSGDISVYDIGYTCIAQNRTPEQMLMIMEALK